MTARVVWILDTNIVAEMMRANPNPVVVEFLGQIALEGIGLSAVTVWEILNGISQLDLGKRRKNLTDRFYGMLEEMFVDRIFNWTSDHARICAQFMEVRRRRGEPLDNHLPDAMIASTAKYLGLTVVTRNEKEFRSAGVRSVNPWARKSV